MDTSTLIIGGGLAGLALADGLEWRGQDYILADARSRFGGRIVSTRYNGAEFDNLGPTWFWPGQPRIAGLIERLGLRAYPQYVQGAQTYEDESGKVQRGHGLATMQGAWRLTDGMSALSRALESRLPNQRKRLNAQVQRLAQWEGKVAVTFAGGQVLRANRVVLAMPPRVAAGLVFDPPLSADILSAMTRVPTWMAGQAKVMAIYDQPFWRKAGLSGDAISRKGPMIELHDASPADGSVGALFGFVGVPAASRRNATQLRRNAIDQLGRLFGTEAALPAVLELKDWAKDPFTAAEADNFPPTMQPIYGLPPAMQEIWGDRIILSGAETATQFGGLVEGALGAAEATLQTIVRRKGYGTLMTHAAR